MHIGNKHYATNIVSCAQKKYQSHLTLNETKRFCSYNLTYVITTFMLESHYILSCYEHSSFARFHFFFMHGKQRSNVCLIFIMICVPLVIVYSLVPQSSVDGKNTDILKVNSTICDI